MARKKATPEPPPPGPPPPGGSGGALPPESPFREGRADTRLLEKAVKARWPIREEVRPAVMNRLSRAAIDPNVSQREATSAARAIFEADRLNLEAEKADDQRRLTEELVKLR